MLDKQGKKEALKTAREAIQNRFDDLELRPVAQDQDLMKPGGVFVTLKLGNKLRGCIGQLSSPRPIIETIAEMAEAAAFQDDRFPPLTKQESKKIIIEISILSPLKKIKQPLEEIKVGKHGVWLTTKDKTRGGLFLPQVATENNWDLETFMDELCENKAGIDKKLWRENKLDIYTFTAEIFSEKDL